MKSTELQNERMETFSQRPSSSWSWWTGRCCTTWCRRVAAMQSRGLRQKDRSPTDAIPCYLVDLFDKKNRNPNRWWATDNACWLPGRVACYWGSNSPGLLPEAFFGGNSGLEAEVTSLAMALRGGRRGGDTALSAGFSWRLGTAGAGAAVESPSALIEKNIRFHYRIVKPTVAKFNLVEPSKIQ